MKKDQALPSKLGFEAGNFAKNEVWIRIAGFLSLRTENTRETYSGILREWCSFLGAEFLSNEAANRILHATDLHAMAYRNWLNGQPGEKPRIKRSAITPASSLPSTFKRQKSKADGLQATLGSNTIRKKLAALRRIYRLLVDAGLGIKKNPFASDSVPAPRSDSGQKRPTEMIDFKLVKKIVAQANESTPKGLRDKALLSILFGGGLRRSEVLGLRLADVRRTKSGTTYLYLRSTKSGRDATQAIPNWVSQTVWKLVESRRKQKASDGDYLVISYRGRGGKIPVESPLSAVGLYKLFKRYCRLAGAGAFVSPHSARATAITKLLDDGLSHREVKEFSRHSSVQMVEVYDKRRVGVDQNPGKKLDYD